MKTFKFLTALFGLLLILLALTGAAATAVTLAPGTGPPTTNVTVTGTGFGASEAVDVFFDFLDLRLAATDATGRFVASIKVPPGIQPGQHWITAIGRKSGLAARGLLAAHPRTGSPHIFPGRGGNQRTDINKQVTRIKEAAGLPKDFRALHGLRHTYASMLASSGQVDLHPAKALDAQERRHDAAIRPLERRSPTPGL